MKRSILILILSLSFFSCSNQSVPGLVYVEYFKQGQILLPDYACPDTLIVRDALGLNTAFAPIEQGFTGNDFGDEQYDSLFHVYCDYYEGSFEDQFKKLKALHPSWDSLYIVTAIDED